MYYTYILSDASKKSFIVGYTNDLIRSKQEHVERQQEDDDTVKIDQLVYYRAFDEKDTSAELYKKLQEYATIEKHALIEASNPDWLDLENELS